MKLSLRDVGTTAFAIVGAAIVYAKFYDFSWALIGSWRMATLGLGLVAIMMFAFSGFDFANRSALNIGEIWAGVVMSLLAVAGVIYASSTVFYALAIVMGLIWLVDTARHARHSFVDSGSNYYPHVHAR